MSRLTIDEALLRELQAHAERIPRGELEVMGRTVSDIPAVEDLRRAIDVLGAHTREGLAHRSAYIAALSTAQEAERGRLARELHDEVVQQLVALGHSVGRVQRLLERGEGAQAVGRLQTMHSAITDLIGEVRALIGDLRPPALEELGLLPAVELLLQRRDEQDPQVALLVFGEPQRLAPQSELALFRIVQEAWQNIRRHARAAQVEVLFRYRTDSLTVTIADDGIGFTPARAVASDGQWGLRGMRERAELIGGRLEISGGPGRGTMLAVTIPYPGVNDRDPVCGMSVGPDADGALHDGRLYRFCSAACRELFLAQPAHYTTPHEH